MNERDPQEDLKCGDLTLFVDLPAPAARQHFVAVMRDKARRTLDAHDPETLSRPELWSVRAAIDAVAARAASARRGELDDIIRARREPHEKLHALLSQTDALTTQWRGAAESGASLDADHVFRDLVVKHFELRSAAERLVRADERPTTIEMGEGERGGVKLFLVAQTGHGAAITRLAFDARGARFVTVGADQRAISWDASTGYELHTFWLDEAELIDPRVAALSPDGARILVADARQCAIREVLAQTTSPTWLRVTAAGFTDDASSQVVFAGSRLDIAPVEKTYATSTFGDALDHDAVFAVSPRGDLVLRAAPDGSTSVWSVAGKNVVRTLGVAVSSLVAAAISGDSGRAVTLDAHGLATLWDLATGDAVRRVTRVGAIDVSLSGDGALLAVTSAQGVELIDLRDASPSPDASVAALLADLHGITAAALSPSTTRPLLVVGTSTGVMRAIDCAARVVAWTFTPERVSPTAITFTAERVCEVQNGDRATHRWDLMRGCATVSREVTRVTESVRIEGTSFGSVLRRASDGAAFGCYVAHERPLRRAEYKADAGRVLLVHEDGRAHVLEAPRAVAARSTTPSRGARIDGRLTGSLPTIHGPVAGIVADSWMVNTRVLFGVRAPRTTAVGLSERGTLLAVGSVEGPVVMWHVDRRRRLCAMLSFDDGRWVVVDAELRFDSSQRGAATGLHWVSGVEPIELRQLRDRYYDPGLLAKRLGWRQERLRPLPDRGVSILANSRGDRDLAPFVHAEVERVADDVVVRVQLTVRGGGVGRLRLMLNGKPALVGQVTVGPGEPTTVRVGGATFPAEVSVDEATGEQTIAFSYSCEGNRYALPNRENRVVVTVADKDDAFTSRGAVAAFTPPPTAAPPRRLWVIVAGTSNYAGDSIDLNWAASDASKVAAAVEAAARSLAPAVFAEVRTSVFSTEREDGRWPTKVKLTGAFEDVATNALSTDALFVYLVGHGAIVREGADDDFYYLTQECESFDLSDSAVRSERTLSSAELTGYLARIAAVDQLVVLDACHAGQLVLDRHDTVTAPSDTGVTADAMASGAGCFVLVASGADKVSWESNRYQQGLLAYATLLGVRAGLVGDGGEIDAKRLCDHVCSAVPKLAEGDSGKQEPFYVAPEGGRSFVLGKVGGELAQAIVLATPLPVVVRSSFHDANDLDPLDLGARFDEAFRAWSPPAEGAWMFFLDLRRFASAWLLVGHYSVDAGVVRLSARLHRDGGGGDNLFERSGSVEDVVSAVLGDMRAKLTGAV